MNWWPGTEVYQQPNWLAGSGYLKRAMRYGRGLGQCAAWWCACPEPEASADLASLIRAAPDPHTTQGVGVNVIQKVASVVCRGSVCPFEERSRSQAC